MTGQPICPVTGKRCYTKNQAKAAASYARRRAFGRITKYRCEAWPVHPSGAGHFHIGHPPRVNTRRRRRFKVRPL